MVGKKLLKLLLLFFFHFFLGFCLFSKSFVVTRLERHFLCLLFISWFCWLSGSTLLRFDRTYVAKLVLRRSTRLKSIGTTWQEINGARKHDLLSARFPMIIDFVDKRCLICYCRARGSAGVETVPQNSVSVTAASRRFRLDVFLSSCSLSAFHNYAL